MVLWNWRKLGSWWEVRTVTARRRGAPRLRTSIESLESRALLATITVTTLADNTTAGDNQVTLREAVNVANNGGTTDTGTSVNGLASDTIVFAAGLTGTINLTLGQLNITNPLIINGPNSGPGLITIDAGNVSRVFNVTGTAPLAVSKLTLQNGLITAGSSAGGAILFASTGALTIDSMQFINNRVTGALSTGGAVSTTTAASVSITNSTFSRNTATSDGGAVLSGGGPLTISGSTFDGNTAGGRGGAVAVTVGTFTVTNSTFTGNMATGDGGGLFYNNNSATFLNDTFTMNTAGGTGGGVAGNVALAMRNTIVAGNTATGMAQDVTVAAAPAAGTFQNNLIGTGENTALVEAQTADAQGNLIGGTVGGLIDPMLGALGNYGGLTMTHSLLVGSRAINAGSNAAAAALTGDQRGSGRFFRLNGANVDIGAYELQAFSGNPLLVDNSSDENDGVYTVGDLSLREAVYLSNGFLGTESITFANALNGVTQRLRLGEIVISEAVTIGSLTTTPVVSGNFNSRIFNILDTTTNVTLTGMTLRDGSTTADNAAGGAILSGLTGTLTITNGTITGNATAGDNASGGAIASDTGNVVITNSTLSNNLTLGSNASGGAVAVNAGNLTITSSTLSGNNTFGLTSNGGAIATDSGQVFVTNSTLSGNMSQFGNGGAIWINTSPMTVTNTTIALNSATSGGGLFQASNTAITVRNSIIATNTAGSNDDLNVGTSLTLSSSLIGSNAGTGLTASAPVDVNGNYTADADGNFIGTAAALIDPVLGTLANNGGLTATHALLAGSPAINTASLALAVNPVGGATLTLDQRGTGFPRNVGGVDMGSFENQDPFNDPPVNNVGTVPQVAEGSSVTITNLSISDPDAGNNPVMVTLTATNGSFVLSTGAGLTFSVGAALTPSATKTFTGTIAAINAALSGLVFTPTPLFNGMATLRIVTNDQGFSGLGGPLMDDDTANIFVTGVNDAPVNDVPTAQTAFAGIPLFFSTLDGNALSISDVDAGANPVQATLFATNGRITLAGNTGLVFTSGDGNNDVSMTFTGSIADINTALDGLSFTPTDGFSGQAQITLINNDQGNTGGSAKADTDVVDISVTPGNIAPVNTLPATQTVVAGQPLTFLSGTSTLAGNWSIAGQTTRIIANGSSLLLTNEFGQSVQGRILNESQIIADGWGGLIGNVVGGTAAGSVINWANNTTWSRPAVPGNLIAVSDADAGNAPLMVTLTAANGTVSLSSTAGLTFVVGDGTADATMTFTGAQSNINAALAGAVFVAPANFAGATTLTITTDDQSAVGGGPRSDTDVLTINVTAAPVAPPVDNSFTANLSGTWLINGQQTSITQNGSQLTFRNEFGQTAQGRVVNGTQIIADTWGGLVGNLSSANTINWGNNTTWTRAGVVVPPAPPAPPGPAPVFPTLATNWVINVNQNTTITVTADGLLFTNEFGASAAGRFLSPTQVVATGWGNLVGTLSSNNHLIQWSNNTRWTDAAFAGLI